MITIISYGSGNIQSIQNMLKKIGVKSTITSEANIVESASHLILPGVGNFDYGMNQLTKSGLIPLLNKKVLEDKVPTLGICLGAQILGNKSEEGVNNGLGWVDMEVVKFDAKKLDASLKVPHMNWSEINIKKSSKLFNHLNKESRFYFVHSYHMKTNHSEDVLCTSQYGYEFVSGVNKDNIWGIQFHPEKSHKFGMQLLTNFSKITS